jgi:dCMP deaminase
MEETTLERRTKMNEILNHWDVRFLNLCRLLASWSKDPSTKTGAAIIRPDKTICSVGFNGFPPGIADTEERLNNREIKYQMVIHCEMNALLLTRESVKGYTLYTTPCLSCARCAVHVIRSGIARVVAPAPTEDILSRWDESLVMTRSLFREAGVVILELA